MNNDEKYSYARYIQAVGAYHYNIHFNYRMAIKYFIRALEISDNLKGYKSLKWSLLYHLTLCNSELGQVQEAKKISKL